MFIVPLARFILPLLVGGLFVMGGMNTMYNLPAKDSKAQVLQTEAKEQEKQKVPEELIGQWITHKEFDIILEKYGDIPVIVKGGGERGIFPISELIEGHEAFINKHPDIIYIREVWIPTKSNIKSLKEHGSKEYNWYKHITDLDEDVTEFKMPLDIGQRMEIYKR